MSKINLFDKILTPVVTEKSTNLSEYNKASNINITSIKIWLLELFILFIYIYIILFFFDIMNI